MQSQNGLSIVFYPAFPSTRKRLHTHTWPAVYESKIHHRINNINNNNTKNSPSSSSQQRQIHNHRQQGENNEQQQQQQQAIQCDYINIQQEGGGSGCIVAGTDGFSKVPHEIMMVIMDDLEVTDIISLSMVNRKLRAHTQDNYLWRQILLKQYGEVAIQDHNDRLLSLTSHRKGKWKCKPKQIPSITNWQKVYMGLSTVRIKTKTAFSRGRPGTFYRYRDFDIKDNEPSNNRIRQKQSSFNIEMTISNVPPGIYDVIWRMRIDKSLEKPIINFSTDIWLRHDIYLNSYEREAKYKYSPDPEELTKAFDKGWFHFRLPYQIEIAKIENSEDRRYQVHTGIYCYIEGLTKSSSVKGPFSVDNVCLRPHIPYDHCPTNNSLNHLSADNETLYSDYDCDSTDENFSITHNNSSNFSVDKNGFNRKRNSLRGLRKNHKRLSKILCVS